jgi:hypothetical protein
VQCDPPSSNENEKLGTTSSAFDKQSDTKLSTPLIQQFASTVTPNPNPNPNVRRQEILKAAVDFQPIKNSSFSFGNNNSAISREVEPPRPQPFAPNTIGNFIRTENKAPQLVPFKHAQPPIAHPEEKVQKLPSKEDPPLLPKCMDLIQHMKSVVNPVLRKPEHREFTKNCRKCINTAVGQITNAKQVIFQVFKKLNTLIDESRRLSDHHYDYTLNQFSKVMCRQTETEVGTSLKRAYSFAHVIVLVSSLHPKLVDFMLARMYKKCPYLIPTYPTAKVPEERQTKLRMKKDETFELYQERMSGIVALFAALVQTQPISSHFSNHWGMGYGWTFIAKILNRPPQAPTALILRTFLYIGGARFIEEYGAQAKKLLNLLMDEYVQKCPSETVAEKVRLEMFLDEDYRKSGYIKVLDERDPIVSN